MLKSSNFIKIKQIPLGKKSHRFFKQHLKNAIVFRAISHQGDIFYKNIKNILLVICFFEWLHIEFVFVKNN